MIEWFRQMATEVLHYQPPIPYELDNQYRAALSRILRWQGGTLPSDVEETNLNHVLESLNISNQIKNNYPNIAREIDFTTVNNMIYLHDAGEILTGDLCLSRPDFDEVKNGHKKREKAAMRYLIRSIDNPQTKQMVSQLARRYLQNSPTDRESLLARLVDKIQALHFGLEHVYPSPKTNEEKYHVARAVRLVESTSQPLSQMLSPNAQTDVNRLIDKQWNLIKSHGFLI